MTTSKEQEAFGLVVGRHKSSASENDIRNAFQRFMETAGVAAASEMTTERPPGVGNPGRMDLYVHNTCIEFKTNILRGGAADPEYVAQLDGYLKSLLKAGSGVRNGILTDGVHYFLRRVGEEDLPLQKNEIRSIFDRAEQAPRYVSTCMESSQPRPITSAPRQRTLKGTSGTTPTHSWPATCC